MTQLSVRISVIICAYTERRWDELVASVASVQAQQLAPQEIILVIDHHDALYQRAKRCFPGVLVVENARRRGLSGARNTGVELAQGTLIAFIDEDAVAEPDWLLQLSSAFSTADVMGVGGAILPRWAAGRPQWFPDEFDWVVGCTYRGLPTRISQVRNLIGCNMSFRREIFELVGGFRDGVGRIGTLPMGCEETELCIRAQQHWPTGRFLFQPLARVQHHVPGQRAHWRYFSSRCYAEGISKALISGMVGAQDSLGAEWSYTTCTLPRGIARGLKDLLAHGDLFGLMRALAITLGLLMTVAGYAVGTLQRQLGMRRRGQAGHEFEHGLQQQSS